MRIPRIHNSFVRQTGSHAKEQFLRFSRLFGIALGAQLSVIDFSHVTRSVIIATAVGAAEVAVRQYAQVVPAIDLSPVIAVSNESLDAGVDH